MIQTHPVIERWRGPRRCHESIGAFPRTSKSLTLDRQSPITSLIGQTPLVRLTRVAQGLPSGVALYAKLEGFNPGGSVKDRAALFIVWEALRTRALTPGKTLLDATSGNTGIAYAMLGAALGFPVQLVMPSDVSPERVHILRAYGAQLILSDPAEKTDGARRTAQVMATESPDRYFYADQYSNAANPLAHHTTTGPEIWQQTRGRLTHFVACMGTTGTMVGAGRYLRGQNPAVHLVGVQPDSPNGGIDGLKYLATDEIPAIYDPGLVDRQIALSGEEAREMARRLAREEGLFVGISAGAAVAAALRVACELESGVVVALLPDGGFKYASAPFWGEP